MDSMILELFSNLNNSIIPRLPPSTISTLLKLGWCLPFPHCTPVPGSFHCLPPSAKSWHQPKAAGNFPLFRLQFRAAPLSGSMGRWPAPRGHGGGRCPPTHDKGGPSGGHRLRMRRPPGKAAQRQSLLAAGDTVRMSHACHVVLKTQRKRLFRVVCERGVSQGGDASAAAESLISGPHTGTAYRGPLRAMAGATAPRWCCCQTSAGVKGLCVRDGSRHW